MQRIVALALIAFPLFVQAQTTPRVITQPDWLTMPDGEMMSRVYPKLAVSFDVEGSAVISCKVTDLGQLVACTADREAPSGFGFGPAALALAPAFRMKPMQVDGRPTSDGTVRIPITFKLPTAIEGPSPSFSPRAASHIQLATEVASLIGLRPADYVKRTADELEFLTEGADQEKLAAAASSLRTSVKVFDARFLAGTARVYADLYTEAELRQWRDVLKSPGGRVQMENPTLAGAMAKLKDRVVAKQVELSREAFCKRIACPNDLDLMRIGRADEDVTIEVGRFTEGPDEAALYSAMPPLGYALGVSGYVRLACRVTAEGLLTECQARDEAPKAMGFGPAAVSLAPYFRLAGDQVGQGAKGELVNVFIPFEAPERDGGEEWGLDPTPANRALAAQLIERFTIGSQTDRFEKTFPPSPGQTPEVRAAASKALDEAVEGANAYWLDQAIRIMGSSYTEAELRGAAAFRASPLGAKQKANRGRLYEMIQTEYLSAMRDSFVEARRIFCSNHLCSPNDPAPQAATSPPSTR